MVRPSGAPSPAGSLSELPEPTWRLVLGRGLPTFALEGFLPVLIFYAVWREAGLGAGIAASAAAAGLVVLVQLRRGLSIALAAATLVFIVIQAVVALAANSATVYLAEPVALSACWGVAHLASAAIGRPLVGAFACGWYPFPPDFRASERYRREFGMQSVVWGIYCLARSALRLGALLGTGVGGLVAASFLTGTPILVALVVWGVWHARQAFSTPELAAAPA